MKKLKLNKSVPKSIPIISGSIAGLGYFYLMESGVPKEANVSYLAPISTDVLAWGMGAYMLWKGMQINDNALTFLGSSLISVHISQFASHKIFVKRGK